MNIRELRDGDVIFAHRSILLGIGYDHYGVYVGGNHVIHFSDHKRSDTEIIETSLQAFVNESGGFTIRHFPDTPAGLEALIRLYERNHGKRRLFNRSDFENYHAYSPRETIARARAELGRHAGEYNLVTNNCEHFAVWCKTGIESSSQVNEVLGWLTELGRDTFVPLAVQPV